MKLARLASTGFLGLVILAPALLSAGSSSASGLSPQVRDAPPGLIPLAFQAGAMTGIDPMVDVTFTNKLDQEQHANPTEFVLMDGAGIKHTWRPLAEGCATWDPVNLTKGATLGPKCLSFEATAGKPSPLTLVWTPSGFGGGYSIKLS